jgi:hypothetical protein
MTTQIDDRWGRLRQEVGALSNRELSVELVMTDRSQAARARIVREEAAYRLRLLAEIGPP